jgi:4,5-dihydroxyphthalate decarboxylase
MAVMRESIVRSRPDVVREVYGVLKESRAAAAGLPTGAEDPLRFGFKAVRASVEQLASHAVQQKLIPRAYTAEELFEDALRILGRDGE